MDVQTFCRVLDSEFYAGVPDSLLKPLYDHLLSVYGVNNKHHLITANEGNAAAAAAGYYLSTGRIPVIYLQNSGEGNVVNPFTSLLHEDVYAIPSVMVIGWRGEPDVHDEPQHVFQGKITLDLLNVLHIPYLVIDEQTSAEELQSFHKKAQDVLHSGNSVAYVIKKNALSYSSKNSYHNDYPLYREEIIGYLVEAAQEDPIISTTGKASRELFEIREKNKQKHEKDFLTVGSMGHSSSIALSIALQKPEKRVWCIDGDGAALMHMGSMGVIGACKCENLIHIMINNAAHESVGGAPTVADQMDWISIARACGYSAVYCAHDRAELIKVLDLVRNNRELTFIEIKCAIGARADLGRPTTSPAENKNDFMNYLNKSQGNII